MRKKGKKPVTWANPNQHLFSFRFLIRDVELYTWPCNTTCFINSVHSNSNVCNIVLWNYFTNSLCPAFRSMYVFKLKLLFKKHFKYIRSLGLPGQCHCTLSRFCRARLYRAGKGRIHPFGAGSAHRHRCSPLSEPTCSSVLRAWCHFQTSPEFGPSLLTLLGHFSVEHSGLLEPIPHMYIRAKTKPHVHLKTVCNHSQKCQL